MVATYILAMATSQQVLSLSGLLQFFREDPNVVGKGEVKFECGFVLEVSIHGLEISARVRAFMKGRSNKVGLVVDGNGNIHSASCECAKGNWLCSHMAATAIYINKKGFSKTSMPNSWIARPKQATKQDIGSKAMSNFLRPQSQSIPQHAELSRRKVGTFLGHN